MNKIFELENSKSISYEANNSYFQQEEQKKEEEDDNFEIDLEKIEPHKFNWFKYLIDKHLQHNDEDGNTSALHNADSYISLLNTVTSTKSDDEIQGELLDLVGFHNFTLLGELLSKREAIKIYT